MNFKKFTQLFQTRPNEFDSFQTLISDLLIFNYINFSEKENSVGILGVDIKSRKNLLIYKFDSKQDEYKKNILYEHDRDILFAQPFDFTNEQKLSYLITSKNDGKETYFVHFHSDNLNILVDNESTVIPLVFTDESKNVSFYYETKSEAYICTIKDGKLSKEPNFKFNLSQYHSSSTLPVNSNFKSIFALEVKKNDKKFIEFYDAIISKPNNTLQPIQTINLPDDNTTTALNFSDLRGSSNLDVLFGYNSDNGPVIRIYLNADDKDNQCFQSDFMDIKIENSEKLKFITENNGDNEGWFLKTNVSANYIEGDNYPNLMTLLENTDTNTTLLKIFSSSNKKETNKNYNPHTVDYMELDAKIPLQGLEHIISVSYVDLFNNQEELLIVNSLESTSASVHISRKVFGKSNTHIKCAVVNGDPENNEQIPIPGISVQYRLIEKEIAIRGTQTIKSSHLHLDPPFSHVGLGNLSACIDQMIIGPFYNDKDKEKHFKTIDKQLFPNSYLVLFIKGDKIIIKQFINLTFTVSCVVYVFSAVLAINLIIFSILAIREKIRIKKKNKAQTLSPIFESF